MTEKQTHKQIIGKEPQKVMTPDYLIQHKPIKHSYKNLVQWIFSCELSQNLWAASQNHTETL